MSTPFKKLLLISITLLLGVMNSGVSAQSVTQVSGNEYAYFDGSTTTNYDFTSVIGSYDQNSRLLQSQVWWNDQSTAKLFSEAVQLQVGHQTYATYAGPFFAYTYNTGRVIVAGYGANPNPYFFDYNLSSSYEYTYAVATAISSAPEIDGSLAPKVGFLLGCLFLMFGRKKQNAESMLTA